MTSASSTSAERPVASIRTTRLIGALSVDGLAELKDAVLLAYLKSQRWFGAKGGPATTARVAEIIPLPWDEGRICIAMVEVGAGDNISRYQLPLSLRRIDTGMLANFDPGAVIAQVKADDGAATLIDATYDPSFQKGVAAAFLAPREFDSPSGSKWRIDSLVRGAPVFGVDPSIRVGSAEQSNSALIFNDRAFLKLFRKIAVGVQPDVEMTRFLTVDASFPYVPTLLGTIEYETADGEAVAGIMQEYMAGSRDAWSYILDTAKPGASPAVATRDIERLGRITRELHDALASPAAERAGNDFAPVHAGAGDVERWAQRTKEMIREAVSLLDKQRSAGKIAGDRAGEAEVLVRRRDHYLTWIEEVADLIGDDGGSRIRVHGDYHLGQVLHTKADAFMIIDFEGEPTRSLAERREKTSALRDVAGMLRSLAYAAATLVQMESKSKHDQRTAAERELVSGRWERDARSAFLRGYTASMKDERGLLPQDPKNFDALLSLFEAEKAFYELAYELNHRPGWEWIPMRGISRLLVKNG